MSNSCISCDLCTPEKLIARFDNMKEKYKNEDTSQFKYDENIYSKPTSILLGLTNDCNLQCSYCFVKQNNTYMDYQTAENALEWVIKNGEEKKVKPLVTFFGGEPLLAFNSIIVPIVEKYKEKVDFSITTNGVLLDEDKIDFFWKNNINVLLSFDGIQEVQNNQRKGKNEVNSYKAVLNNIPYLILRQSNSTMRMTITKNSLPYLYENVLMAEELGFKNIFFCPNAYEEWTQAEEGKILTEQLTKIGKHIYTSFFNTNSISIKVSPLIDTFNNIEKSLKHNLFFNNTLLKCGMGTTSCGIAPNGDIVPCQEKTSNPTFIIGNVNQGGIKPDAHENFLEWYIKSLKEKFQCKQNCSEKQCLHCLANICPSRLEDLNFQISSAECVFITAVLKEVNRLYMLCNNSINPLIEEYFEGKE